MIETIELMQFNNLLFKLENSPSGEFHVYLKDQDSNINVFTKADTPQEAIEKAYDTWFDRLAEPVAGEHYLHFKGVRYEVVEVKDSSQDLTDGQKIPGMLAASDIKKGDRVVVYRNLETKELFVCTVANFCQDLGEGDRTYPRFQFLGV